MFMRKNICNTVNVLITALLVAGILGLSGCKSLSSNQQGWLTPKPVDVDSLQEVPATVLGQSAAGPVDPFSSTQYQSIQAEPQPIVQQYQPFQPQAVPPAVAATSNDPFLADASPQSVNVVAQQPVAVATATGSVYDRSVTETPQQAAVIDQSRDIPPSAVRPIHDPFAGIQQIPSHYDAPAAGSGSGNPWDIYDPDAAVRNAVSIEEAAKKEEEIKERARLEELAAGRQKDGTPDYLKPLDKWNGPFENREKKENIEHQIISQVSHVDVKKTYDNTPVYDWEKEEEKGFDWEVLDPVNFFTKVRDWMGMGPDEKKANAAMQKGRNVLEPLRNKTPDPNDKKKWLEAAGHFEEAAKRWPNSVTEEDGLHLAAECYFFGENYPKAMTSYQKLIINYQHSKYVDNAVRRLFRIGRYWELEDQRGVSFTNMSRTNRTRPTFDTFGYAKKAYEAIFINDPNGPISDDAVMALATAYLFRGRYKGDVNYEQAAYYYKYLRENFPLSPHLAKAHENEILARTNAYLGAEHNSTSLEEAGKLADITLKQFGGELEAESREEILAQKEEIIASKAEKEWVTGQFYDKKSLYGAARLQYEKILDQYPQTPYAEKARVRLQQIKHKPDQPDKYEFFKKLYMPRGTI